jgi:membrane protein implicated in regulation of membrane protease activity
MVRVTAVDGRTWTVRRRWAPRHESFARGWLDRRDRKRAERDGPSHWWDVLDLPGDVDGLVILLVAIPVIIVLALFGVLFLLALVDLALLLLLFTGGVVARIVFRRPWTVEARADDGEVRERQVVGWRRAGEAVDDLAAEVSRASSRPDGPRW